MTNGTIIMLCGLPGSGKTTLAKELESKKQVVRLCPDEWIIPLLKDSSNMVEADRLRGPVEKLLLDHAISLTKLGYAVALENGFWSESERDQYRETIKKSGARVELHFLDAPLETLRERVNNRNKEVYPFKIEAHNLEKWYYSFEAPSETEGKKYDFYKIITMAELKTKATTQDPKEFLNTIEPEEKRKDAFTLLEMFKKVTGEKAVMWGKAIIGFGKFHYKSERSTQEGDWPLTGFSPRKQSLTLYLMQGFKDDQNLLKKLGKHTTSVGCLYIKKLSDVDQTILTKLIENSFKQMKEMYK